MARSNIRHAHYTSYKRALLRMYYFILGLSRTYSCWTNDVVFDLLVGEDSSKHRMVPWRGWEDILLDFVNNVVNYGVYDDFVLWFKDSAEKGVLVNVFAIWWGLVGAPHVSTLSYKKRKEFVTPSKIFVGMALHSLGRLVKELEWDKQGYPLDWPNGEDEPPVLRVHLTPDDEMAQLQKDCKAEWDRSHEHHKKTLKVG